MNFHSGQMYVEVSIRKFIIIMIQALEDFLKGPCKIYHSPSLGQKSDLSVTLVKAVRVCKKLTSLFPKYLRQLNFPCWISLIEYINDFSCIQDAED